MKKFAVKLELKDTHISNPHGMSDNISNTKDIAKLF
jgi:D-alanyl-D-alanine carboxypeptidase